MHKCIKIEVDVFNETEPTQTQTCTAVWLPYMKEREGLFYTMSRKNMSLILALEMFMLDKSYFSY